MAQSLKTSLLPVFDRSRAILKSFGMRDVRVFIRTRQWSSGRIQTGMATVADLEIVPSPRCDAAAGDPIINVVNITPKYAHGGYTPQDLNPSEAAGIEFYYVVINADGVERPYRLQKLSTTRNFGYKLTLEALDRAVPF